MNAENYSQGRQTNVYHFDLSVRCYNTLKANNITTLGQLIDLMLKGIELIKASTKTVKEISDLLYNNKYVNEIYVEAQMEHAWNNYLDEMQYDEDMNNATAIAVGTIHHTICPKCSNQTVCEEGYCHSGNGCDFTSNDDTVHEKTIEDVLDTGADTCCYKCGNDIEYCMCDAYDAAANDREPDDEWRAD